MTAEIEREIEIERGIERTRDELAVTLAALERKLSGRYLVERGFDMFRDRIGEDGVNRTMEFVRANPVPLALVGLAAAWLVASNTDVADRIARDERVGRARRRAAELAGDIGNRAGELASTVAERVGLRANGEDRPLGYTGSPMIDQPMIDQTGAGSAGWTHQAADRARGAIRSARDSGGAMLRSAGERAGRIADPVVDAVERHPLLVGAVGMMAGVLVAVLLPRTRLEDELLGATRDEFWHKAEQVGQETVARVRDVATRAADAAADAVAVTVRAETDRPL